MRMRGGESSLGAGLGDDIAVGAEMQMGPMGLMGPMSPI